MIEALLGNDPWFAPKKYGYGSGLPIAWQGWVLSAVFIAAILGSTLLMTSGRLLAGLTILIPTTLAFLWLAKRHTMGGWCWRNGE